MKRRIAALLCSALPLLGLCGCSAFPGRSILVAEAKELLVTEDMCSAGIVSEGDLTRVAGVLRRAAAGEPITIAVFGGSITEGAAAAMPEDRYADRVAAWWLEAFPSCELTLVNAGIGATDTILGVHRLAEDVLAKAPDLVIMEFSVNDSAGNNTQLGTYESCVRQLLADPDRAVLIFCMDSISTQGAADSHEMLGQYYGLPVLNYGDAYRGADFWQTQTSDGLHPLSDGHRRAGLLIARFLMGVNERRNGLTVSADAALPAPLTATAGDYEGAYILDLAEAEDVEPGGFVRNTEIAYRQKHEYYGYTANGGAPLTFTVTARSVYLLLRHGPGEGVASIVSSDGTAVTVALAADWGSYMWATPRLHESDEPTPVTITVSAEGSVTVLAALLAD